MSREKGVMSRSLLEKAVESATRSPGPATKKAEQQAHSTGKLHPLVDPAGFGAIRRSLPRLEEEKGLWKLLFGPPIAIETRGDTTSSMGDNVDIMLRVLPTMYTSCIDVLPNYDMQIATGVFNDAADPFVLCRPQFEMDAEKIVQQLGLMVPVRRGGDEPEDPQYGLFGGAFLTDAHINRLGLRYYDFTISDAPGRDYIDERLLRQIFGPDVFDKVKDNGHQVTAKDMPTTKEVVQELLKRAHAFFILVGDSSSAYRFWKQIYTEARIIQIPDAEMLPQVQAALIGLTEGSLELGTCETFLKKHQVSAALAKNLVKQLAGIPLGAQAALPNFSRLPKKGDLFKTKTSPWPVDPSEVTTSKEDAGEGDGAKTKWL